jgi:hypothetical protein
MHYAAAGNSTDYWLGRRAALIDDVFGYGPGVLSNKSVPDKILKWDSEPNLEGLVWDMNIPGGISLNITSTVFYSPVNAGQRSKSAFFFHHGHSNCVCPRVGGNRPTTQGTLSEQKCRPGCNSSMPSGSELHMPGYSWWDLYNVSEFAKQTLGMDVFIFR